MPPIKRRKRGGGEAVKKLAVIEEAIITSDLNQGKSSNKKESTVASVIEYDVPLQGETSSSSSLSSSTKNVVKVSRRRSSFSLRGKRQSSMGTSQVLPHASIASKDFHKHISPELPDPLRMRQLMVWAVQFCCDSVLAKNLDDKNGNGAEERNQLESVKDEIISGLMTGEVKTSWYQRPKEKSKDVAKQVSKPNPVNIANKKILSQYESTFAELSKEKAQWENAFTAFEKHLEQGTEAGDDQLIMSMDQDQDPMLSSVSEDVLNTLIKDSESFFEHFMDSVTQFSKDGPINHLVNHLYSTLSTTLSFERYTREYCEKLFKIIFKKFFKENENNDPVKKNEILEVLRALSRTAPTTNNA